MICLYFAIPLFSFDFFFSRIPEESASSSLNFNSHQQSTSAVDTHHQSYSDASNIHQQQQQQQQHPYPEAPKRRRMTSRSSREELNDKAQQFIDEINEKRKADTVLLADFKKAMEMQVKIKAIFP